LIKVKLYTKPDCPYCKRAKALLQSKGIVYEEDDITQHGKDWPQKLFEITGMQTVPQIYIGGQHVGGFDDLSQLSITGELDDLLCITSDVKQKDLYDLLIIGCGPAGMSAAIYAARMKLKIAIVTIDEGGQLNLTSGIENYPGYSGVDSKDLIADFRNHVGRHDVPVVTGEEVTGIEVDGLCKRVTTASGKVFLARAVIIASGNSPRLLNAKGEKDLIGRGITFCGICDGPIFENKRIVVIGGGNSGYEEALEMSKFAEDVYIITDKVFAQPVLVDRVSEVGSIHELVGFEVIEFIGGTSLEGIVYKSIDTEEESSLRVEGAFIKIGMEPNSSFVVNVLRINDRGEIDVDCGGDTGISGLFAAGDVAAGLENQVVIATGTGASAALKAARYLREQR